MKSATFRMICRLLIVSLVVLPFQTASAGMIGTDRAVSASTAQADRQAVLSLISRSEVASQLQSMGIDPKTAADRVTAMTDEEVRTLAGKIDSLPAGAKVSGGTWALLLIIAGLLWYYYMK